MSNQQSTLDTVRAVDPLDPAELDGWLASDRPGQVLASIRAAAAGDPPPTARRQRIRRASVLPLALGVVAVGGGAAVATTLLGSPAPQPVRDHLAELDRGMPADLRYNADVEHARAVAASAAGTLYAADLPDGGYCLEVASDTGTPRGATCLPAADASAQAIEATAPLPASAAAPLLVGGRVQPSITRLVAMFTDGVVRDVPLSADGYFLLQIDAAQQASAYTDGLRLSGYDGAGERRAVVALPAFKDDAAHHPDEAQPLFVSTVSDGTDFTMVRALTGHVNVPGFDLLTLTYPDGSTTDVAVRADGSYRFDIPRARQRDFARAFGRLTATDASGHVLATAPVASVAAWRAYHP